MSTTPLVGRCAAAAAIALILVATLTPTSGPEQPFLFCILCGDRGAADAVANVILYLPLGLTLAALTGRPVMVVLSAALLSTCIEVTQAVAIPGRDGAFGDIVFNTAGAATGVAIIHTRGLWLDPSPRLSRCLGAFATIIALAVVLLTGFLTSLSLPNTRWFGQWTPQFGGSASRSTARSSCPPRSIRTSSAGSC
ncbi:MAG TPA: VanZ family protein [Gemmatimonadaceae bacterium]|nr:VanZ family protein [Gemmatimonadaceae bacterium]